MERLRDAWREGRVAIFDRSMRSLAESLARTALASETLPEPGDLRTRLRQAGAALGIGKADATPAASAQKALADRLDAETRASTLELITFHGLGGSAGRDILARLGNQYEMRLRLDEKQAAAWGGAVTGALVGLKADVLSGGLTFGGGLLTGGVLGALGSAGLARCVNLVRGTDRSLVAWKAEALDAIVEAALLRYLAVAHFGRGRGDWAQGEPPAHWNDVVADAIAPYREALDAAWGERDLGRRDGPCGNDGAAGRSARADRARRGLVRLAHPLPRGRHGRGGAGECGRERATVAPGHRMTSPHIKALVFDVFGTVVDWRSGVIRDGEALAAAKGLTVDWPAFADAWRAGYQPAMQRARSGEIAWTHIDGLHRAILDTLLPRFGLESLDEGERAALNRVWHRLDPWPDVVAGLQRLKRRFTISTLSNGNVSLLVDMAKHGGLPWDCVLSAELFRHYKPDPEVYLGAAAAARRRARGAADGRRAPERPRRRGRRPACARPTCRGRSSTGRAAFAPRRPTSASTSSRRTSALSQRSSTRDRDFGHRSTVGDRWSCFPSCARRRAPTGSPTFVSTKRCGHSRAPTTKRRERASSRVWRRRSNTSSPSIATTSRLCTARPTWSGNGASRRAAWRWPSSPRRRRAADERFIAHVAGLSAAALDDVVALDRGEGRIQRERRGHLIGHLLAHQVHHRGQAHAMLAGTTVPPPQLDEFLLPSEAHLREVEMKALGWSEATLFS